MIKLTIVDAVGSIHSYESEHPSLRGETKEDGWFLVSIMSMDIAAYYRPISVQSEYPGIPEFSYLKKS